MSTAAIVAGTAAAGLAGTAIQSKAAGNAANVEVNAANHAADLQKQASDAALGLQTQEFNQQQQNLAPWLQAGQQGLTALTSGLQSGGQFSTVPQFTAPTGVTEQNDPGYQFRLAQGEQAIQNAKSANGTLFSGATAKGLSDYAQNTASNEYGNVYNRAMQQYQTQLNSQNTLYNRYAGLAGTGQQATQQANQSAQNYANQGTNTYLTTGAQQGQYALDAGSARASGYINQGNIWGHGIGNTANSVLQGYLYSQLPGTSGASGTTAAYDTPWDENGNPNPGYGPCWIARIVYGTEDGTWMIARDAFRRKANTSAIYSVLWELYKKHGESWAERVKRSRLLFAIAKRFFDRLIGMGG